MTTDNTQSGSDTNVTRKDTPTEVVTSKIKGTQAELDEILDAFASGEVSPHWKDNRKTYTKPEAKQAIISLIKELVAEVKPAGASIDIIETYLQNGMPEKAAEYRGINHARDQFEQNLLKALEEK